MGVYTGSGPTDPTVGAKASTTAFGVPASDAIQALAGSWTSYTPTWTATTTNPSIGNGTLAGYYTQVGKFFVFRIRVTMGSTTSFGSGVYRWALPVTPVSLFSGAGESLGNLLCYDSSGSARYARTLYTATLGTVSAIDEAGNQVGPSTPFVFANGDTISINGWGEVG